MKKVYLLLILFCLTVSVFSQELYRIRIENRKEGLVQVSLDKGDNYYAVGKVCMIADKCGVGFMASDYVSGGTVCAVASHALRIKTYPAEKKTGDYKNVRLFSVLPKEFWTVPKGFGGYFSENSAIYTDIHTGTGIFLNFAPFPETKVYREYRGSIYPIENGHIPYEGAIYVIPVTDGREKIKYLEFDNFCQGYVTDSRGNTITNINSPVGGIGRYDATTYNRPGQINTAHGGVITIATSKLFPFEQKEGGSIETRGGFMIQPVYHAERQREYRPQVMTVGYSRTHFEQEGEAPLFSGNISLWYYPENLKSSYYAELKIDDKYVKMPSVTGRVDNGLTKDYLNKHFKYNSKKGVTAVRINIPEFNKKLAFEYLKNLSLDYNSKIKLKDKESLFVSNVKIKNEIFEYYVDGKKIGVTDNINSVEINKNNYVHGLHNFQIYDSNDYIYSEYFFSE